MNPVKQPSHSHTHAFSHLNAQDRPRALVENGKPIAELI
jgi:hypothetical protein